ncbi:MAG: thioredoxin [candidate division WOR-3 bacterium]
MALKLDKTNFEQEVINSQIPVLVDFWASWCMPCQMVAPIIDELANEYAGKVKIGKVNVDEEAELAAQYSIMSIPSLLFFKNGKVVDTIVGAVPKGYLIDKINKIIE